MSFPKDVTCGNFAIARGSTPRITEVMEFTGNIQFADESSWLTLTTVSDDTVTISVRLNTFVPNQEVMSFEVTPNYGIVRLPAGEILSVLKGNGVGMITGVFAATQGTSSCSYSFSVLPCRKFAYKSLAATIFTTRPYQCDSPHTAFEHDAPIFPKV